MFDEVSFGVGRFEVNVNLKDGIVIKVKQPLTLVVPGPFNKDLLSRIGVHMQQPSLQRHGPVEEPDGVVPAELMRPVARAPAPLHAEKLLRRATVSFGFNSEAATYMDEKGTRRHLLQTNVALSVKTVLDLRSELLRGILDNSDQDFGFLYFHGIGYLQKGKSSSSISKTEAFVRLDCGTLEVWQRSSKKKPYRTQIATLELAHDHDFRILTGDHSSHTKDGKACQRVKPKTFFCASPEEINRLQKALNLQRKRFRAIKRVLENCKNCTSEFRHHQLHDGTWFWDAGHTANANQTAIYPMRRPPAEWSEIRSPLHLWQELTPSI